MMRTSLAALTVLLCPPTRAADGPPIGTTLTMPVASAAVSASGTGRESRRVVYAPPPGWYVRSHRVVTSYRVGSVAYSVSTVPAGWAWRAEEQTATEGKSAAAGTLSAYKVSAGGQASAEQSASSSDIQATAASHHALVIDVSARGPGLWRGESGLELTVVAELVYVGR